MPSNRRSGRTLPRRDVRPTPAVAPATSHVSRRGFLIVSGIAALSATGLITTGVIARHGDDDLPAVGAPAAPTADRG